MIRSLPKSYFKYFLVLSLFFVVSFVSQKLFAQTTIYSQDFGTASTFPTGWSTSGTTLWANSPNTISTGYSGASGGHNALHTNNNGVGVLTFSNTLSTVGYSNITVLWAANRTGANLTTFEYSIDGTNWINVSFTDATNNSTWMLVNGGTRISLPANASNVSNLSFRWTHTSANSRYIRIDDFNVQGCETITNQPTSKLTIPGTSTNFSVTAPNATGYQWQLSINGGSSWTNIANGGVYTSTTTATLNISNVTGLGGNQYRCVVTNTCNTITSNAAQLIVITAPTITAGGGGTFCVGSTINLTSSGSNISNQYWTGPNNFYSLAQNPVISNATSDMSGTYTVTASGLSGINLVANGDFELGNTGFSSTYAYSNNNLENEGTYAVVANPHNVHSGFTNCADHSSTGTLQMVINGSVYAGRSIWAQDVSVLPNTKYQFTYWVQSVVAGNPSRLQLYVNNDAAGPVYTADTGTCTWKQFTYNWNSGSSTTAELSLVNQNIVAGGNDFALDDIVFQSVVSAISSVDVTVQDDPLAVTVAGNGTFCGSKTLTASGGSGGTIYFQGTTSNGTSTTTASSSQTVTASGTYYFRSRSSGGCWGPEGSATVTINPISTIVLTSGTQNPTICAGSGIASTVYTFAGSATNATVTGLPAGLSANVNTSTKTVTISGTPTASGTYTITTSGHAVPCNAASITGTVTVSPIPALVTVSGGGTYCGSTTITATGGNGGTIYFQGTTSGGTSTTTASSSQTVSTSGTYYFRARSAAGCWGPEGSTTVFINTVPSMPVVGTVTQPTCTEATGSIALSGLPSSGMWTLTRQPDGTKTTGTGATTVVSGLNPGTYSFNVSNEDLSSSCPGSGTGLKAEYFNNTTLTGSPILTRTDATVDFDWTTGNPGSPLNNDNFSVRWSGQVQACFSELYTFTTRSDDGIRLWVNGTQIITNWDDHAVETNTGTISLIAGQKYTIVLEFYENGGSAVAQLLWSCPSQSTPVVIPKSQLYSEATGCSSASTGNVVINAQPLTPAAPTTVLPSAAASVCQGGSINLKATSAGNTIYWYTQSSGGTSIGSSASGANFSASPTVNTTYYAEARTASGCSSTTRTATALISVNLNLSAVAVTPSTQQNICLDGTGTTLTVAETNGGAIVSRQWGKRSASGGAITPIPGATSLTYTPSGSDLGAGTWYVVCTSTPTCGTPRTSNEVTVAVNESIGGTISGAVSPTCLNSNSGVLTLSGHLGTIVRWERNINSNGWTSIGNTGSTTFTEPKFYEAGAWQYRVVVKNGSCTEAYSSVANIVVDPASIGGWISYVDPICEGSSVSLTLNGSTGAVLRWERRLGSGSWETVAQTTTIITDTPSSGGTWEYRAAVQSGNCNVVYSTSQTVVVNPTLTITLGANPEVCQTITSTSLPFSATTGNPSGWILTFDAAAVSAGFNNPQNGSLGSAPANIPIVVPSNIAVGVYHATLKLRTYSPNCFSTDYPVTITVDPSTVAGTASAGSTQVCRNSGTTLTLVGSVGSIQWQTNASGTWQDISGATSPTYVTPNLLAATSYRARVTSGSCSSMESNVVTITVDSEKPVLANCPTGTLTFAPDAGLCSASINTTTWGQSPAVSATDNCDTAPVINFTRSDGQTNSTFPIGSTTVTLTATDNNGNVSTGCTFTVLVRETTPPSITCPPGQTIFCAANIPAAYTTFAAFQAAGGTASDNAATGCGLSEGTFHLAAQVTSGSTITRTYEIADYSGNTATCNQVFTIISPPTVSITSPGFNITCAGSGFTIHSSVNSYSGTTHYQWLFKAFNGSSWTVVGGDTPSYSGTLANLGDQYRLIISQSTDFSNVSCTSISNELKFMDVTKPVFVIGNAPVNQTICIANGATSASVTNIRLNNEDVADNCTTVFGDLAISYTINGGASVNGNLAEGTSFSLGTSTVVYTVADQSGNYETHTFTITVNENPALANITPDASGLTPDQGSTHSYSVPAEAGYTFTWSVEKEISSGNYSAVSPLITGQGSATVNITWGAATMPGNYRITVVKENNSTNCEATKTLNVTVLNVFNPFVKDYGNSCHNVTGETIIDWIVELSNDTMLGGTYNWSFKWRIKLEGTEIATGTESGVTALSKTISYTVNIGDGSEKNYRFEIYEVTDALGNQETSTTDDTDEVKIFTKPSIQF